MPSFLRGMFQGRRPTTTTRGPTEVPYPPLPAAPPAPTAPSLWERGLHWCRESACETQTQAALSVDEIQRTDAAEAERRLAEGTDTIAKAVARTGYWFPGD